MPSLTWLGPYRQQFDESSNQPLSPPLANPSPPCLEHQLHNSGELPHPPEAERLSRTCTFLTFCLFLTLVEESSQLPCCASQNTYSNI